MSSPTDYVWPHSASSSFYILSDLSSMMFPELGGGDVDLYMAKSLILTVQMAKELKAFAMQAW